MNNFLEKELIEVGYFLSRLGFEDPPRQLNARTWKEAYLKFYSTFGSGKTEDEFKNSLKNLRDHFDSHLSNNRVGWTGTDNLPQQLSSKSQLVFDDLQKLNDDDLWNRIKPYAVTSYDIRIANRKNKEIKETKAKYFSSEFQGERIVSGRSVEDGTITVYHGLIVDSLKVFIEGSIPNSNVYNTQKIDLTLEVDGRLKRIYEVKPATDTQSIYTAVGQLFMHSAGTNDIEKWIVLPGPSENEELIECLATLKISILWFRLKNDKCEFKNHK